MNRGMWAFGEWIILFAVRKFIDLFIYLVLQLINLGKYLANQANENNNTEPQLPEPERRQNRHRIFMQHLADEFGTLDMSASNVIKSATRSERKDVLDKYGGTQDVTSVNPDVDWRRNAIKGALMSSAHCNISRAVSDLSEKEIIVLKTLSFLNSVMLIDDEAFDSVCRAIIYNNGNCMITTNFMDKPYVHSAMIELLKARIHAPGVGLQHGIATVGQVRKHLNENDPARLAEVDREIGGRDGWLKLSSL